MDKERYIIESYKVYDKLDLNRSMSIPSTINAYSIGVQYMREWFLSKFSPEYFKSINIEGRHAFYDFRKMNRTEMLKRLKPSLSIIPQLQFDHTRDMIDSYPFGAERYIKTSNYHNAFLRDYDNNVFLGMIAEEMLINFTFKVRLSTRAQQMDMYKFMQLNMRIGYTQGQETCMDFHIPYNTIIQLAEDANFKVVDDKIVDMVDFISYLNKHSQIPIMYKLRTINGNDEFFLRIKDVYTHISCQDSLSADDGEKEGMMNTNFIIEMNASLKIPSPKMYIYFSLNKHIHMKTLDKVGDLMGIYDVQTFTSPNTNELGWNQMITTEYFEENLDENIIVDFTEFFKNSDVQKIIDYNNELHISSNICIDFLLSNNNKKMKYKMDWKTLKLRCEDKCESKQTYIVIYLDMDYINKILINIEDMMENIIINSKQ